MFNILFQFLLRSFQRMQQSFVHVSTVLCVTKYLLLRPFITSQFCGCS